MLAVTRFRYLEFNGCWQGYLMSVLQPVDRLIENL